jgi:hypothetical protein
MTKTKFQVGLLACCAALIGACGGDESDTAGEEPQTPQAAAGPEYVTQTDLVPCLTQNRNALQGNPRIAEGKTDESGGLEIQTTDPVAFDFPDVATAAPGGVAEASGYQVFFFDTPQAASEAAQTIEAGKEEFLTSSGPIGTDRLLVGSAGTIAWSLSLIGNIDELAEASSQSAAVVDEPLLDALNSCLTAEGLPAIEPGEGADDRRIGTLVVACLEEEGLEPNVFAGSDPETGTDFSVFGGDPPDSNYTGTDYSVQFFSSAEEAQRVLSEGQDDDYGDTIGPAIVSARLVSEPPTQEVLGALQTCISQGEQEADVKGADSEGADSGD